MPSNILAKAIEKLPASGKSSGKNSTDASGESSPRKSSSDRVIPPEPVQQNPHGDMGNEEDEPALALHNLTRAGKSVQKLHWDSKLACDAEEYAKLLAKQEKLEYSFDEIHGENLYFSPNDVQMEDAVSDWMNEEKKYNGEKVEAGNYEDWGHFCEFRRRSLR